VSCQKEASVAKEAGMLKFVLLLLLPVAI